MCDMSGITMRERHSTNIKRMGGIVKTVTKEECDKIVKLLTE